MCSQEWAQVTLLFEGINKINILYLDIEDHAPLLGVGDAGNLSSVGAVSAPAWLQGPGGRTGRRGGGQQLQQQVSVRPHLQQVRRYQNRTFFGQI